MRDVNIIQRYNILTKLFHWMSVIGLVIQIPLGFYLVRQEFSDFRITIEEIHVFIGIVIFYITLLGTSSCRSYSDYLALSNNFNFVYGFSSINIFMDSFDFLLGL